MEKTEILQKFGLTEAEVNLYLTLLRLNEATASELSKKTNTNRTFTYDRLKKLTEFGLVSYVIKDNKKYFKPAEPKQLLSILKEREEEINSILPELEKLKGKKEKAPEIEIFTTKKGIKTALNMMLRQSGEILINGSLKKFQNSMGIFYNIWNKQRIKNKIKIRALLTEMVKLEHGKYDLLPEEETSITTFTFKGRVIITFWADNPIAILIESSEIAKNNKAFFETIWNREVKIYNGVEGIMKANYELVSRKNDTHVGYGFSYLLAKIYGTKLSDDWHKTRLKNNVQSLLISHDDSKSKDYFKKRMFEWKNFKVKFLPEIIDGPVNVAICSHMVITIVYTEKRIRTVVNKNKEVIRTYRKHFDKLWKISKN